MLPLKNNLAADINGLAYSIERYGESDAAVVAWEAEPVRVTADEALNVQRPKPGPKPEQRQNAEQWLRERLAKGQRLAKELVDEAKADGFNERLLQRAFEAVNGERSRRGRGGPWLWSLPIDDTHNGLLASCHPVAYSSIQPIDDTLINRRQDDQLDEIGMGVAYDEFETERQRTIDANESDLPF